MIRLLVLAAFLATAGYAPAQSATTTKPSVIPPATSAPAKANEVEQLFADDTLKFAVPAGWRVTAVAEDTRSVQLKSDDGKGLLIVLTSPQTASLTQNADTRFMMGEKIVESLSALLKAHHYESINPPRIKRDEGFFLRIEDTYREGAKVANRLHVYRVLGIHLLMVAATSYADAPDAVAAVHKTGEDVVYRIKPNKLARKPGIPTTGKPSLFRKGRVKLTPAKGWVEEKRDAEEGVIATYREPVFSGAVTVRVVPMAAQTEPRDAVVARVVTADLASQAVDGATPAAVEAVGGGPFASKSRQKYDRTGLTFRVENRVAVVGDVVLSVTSVSTEQKAEAVGAYADELAAGAEVFAPR